MSRTVRISFTDAQARCVLRALQVLEDEIGVDPDAHPQSFGVVERTRLAVENGLRSGTAPPK